MKYDIVVIGAGPVGLSFACSLINTSVKVLLVEKNSLEQIENPDEDGREIALTHLSLKILKKLGVWDLIDPTEVSPLKTAKVFDGNSKSLLNFGADDTHQALGYLLPNYQMRKAFYVKVLEGSNIDMINDTVVNEVVAKDESSQVLLADGSSITAKLVVAADSRFSQIRRKMGIPTLMQDFSKVMIVTKMRHEHAHNNAALERFDYGKTLALLPMPGDVSSIVLTVRTNESQAILNMSEQDFNALITKDFKSELGQMTQLGERHTYPLVATHAQKFVGKRFALIGDAAVGMHPVTAHGFNLGLKGQDILATLIKQALQSGQDIGAQSLLKLYERKHIRLTKLMFFGTNGVVALFTNDAPMMKPIRRAVLKFAEHFPPIKTLISNHLTQAKQHKLPSLKRVLKKAPF